MRWEIERRESEVEAMANSGGFSLGLLCRKWRKLKVESRAIDVFVFGSTAIPSLQNSASFLVVELDWVG